MRRSAIVIFFITVISILTVNTTCFGETAEGFIDVKIEAPKEFEHSIMINLIDKEGVNYIVVAEKENDWKANSSLPEGEYQVDSVSFEKADTSFKLDYEDKLSIKQGVGSAFFITVNAAKKQEIESKKEASQVTVEKLQERKSFTQRLADLILSILKKNSLSIILIIGILVYMYKKKKEQKKEQSE